MGRTVLPLLLALMLGGCATTPASQPATATSLADLESRARPAMLGVAILDLESGAFTGIAPDTPMPLQSVFKAPLGAAVLAQVDAGAMALDEHIAVTEDDFSAAWSPMAEQWPGKTEWTIAELIELAVGQSDNSAADILMRRIGGPPALTQWLAGHGIRDFSVDRYERELQPESAGLGPFRPDMVGWDGFKAALDRTPVEAQRAALAAYLADPRDRATPRAAVQFLSKLSKGELLSPASTERLLAIMTAATTGADRLKAGLPPGATIAHKTGSGVTVAGFNTASNDIGIATLPNGRRIAIAVFLAGSPLPAAQRDALIADVARRAVAEHGSRL